MAGLELKMNARSSSINAKTSRRGESINNIEVIDDGDAAVRKSQSVIAANYPLKGSKTLTRKSKVQPFIRLLNCCSPQISRENSDDFYGNKNIEDDKDSIDKEQTSLGRDSIEKDIEKTDHSDTILDKVLDRANLSDQVFAMVGPKYKFRDGSR